jgi:hypothetical protein
MSNNTNIRKHALLIGINYINQPTMRLNGCINDVKRTAEFLKSRRGFKDSEITMMTDDVHSTNLTKSGILNQLLLLALQSKRLNLDYCYIHYSGHGTCRLDTSNDELDNFDEGLVSTDFHRVGCIVDDSLYAVLTRFNPKTKVVCMFDCCHSGSILDLPVAYDEGIEVSSGQKNNNKLSRLPPNVFMISGCMDNQTSLDIYVNKWQSYGGAMTTLLLLVLEQFQNQNQNPDLKTLQTNLKYAMQANNFEQRVILSCSRRIDNELVFP